VAVLTLRAVLDPAQGERRAVAAAGA